jgi:uncharacterized protein DUF6644
MIAALISVLDRISNTHWIVVMRDSSYGMPAVQSFHLVGLTFLLGAVFVLNLRLSSVGMRDWSLPVLERQLRPWTLGAAMVMTSGALMFVGTPAKYLASNPFRFKMAMLGLAIVFQFVVFRRFFTADPGARRRSINVVVAAISLTLWFSVGWAGRAIAFVP